MRVVGGQLRGRRLKPPPNLEIRPTSDRIRESMFDLLGPFSTGDNVLDLFSGTGALGIEALSRGYRQAVFVDQDRTALRIIHENLLHCQLTERSRVESMDVFAFLENPDLWAPFSLVLLDPPYRQGMAERTLQRLGLGGWVDEEGVVICEVEKKLVLPDCIGRLVCAKHKKYGDSSVYVYFHAADSPGPHPAG